MVRAREYFQDAMPGDVCFGCGDANPVGLKIKSFWEGDDGVCHWHGDSRHQGWPGIACGGILATLIDCHCMATAMAALKREEGVALTAEPHYRFATGRMALKYLKPTPIDERLVLRARILLFKEGRKASLACTVEAAGVITVAAEVVAVLVYRSDKPELAKSFKA